VGLNKELVKDEAEEHCPLG